MFSSVLSLSTANYKRRLFLKVDNNWGGILANVAVTYIIIRLQSGLTFCRRLCSIFHWSNWSAWCTYICVLSLLLLSTESHNWYSTLNIWLSMSWHIKISPWQIWKIRVTKIWTEYLYTIFCSFVWMGSEKLVSLGRIITGPCFLDMMCLLERNTVKQVNVIY